MLAQQDSKGIRTNDPFHPASLGFLGSARCRWEQVDFSVFGSFPFTVWTCAVPSWIVTAVLPSEHGVVSWVYFIL